jgi:hypothetical protein
VTQGTYTWPQADWNAWNSYMATRTEPDVPVASATGDGVITPGSRDQSNLGTPNSGRREESNAHYVAASFLCLMASLTLA